MMHIAMKIERQLKYKRSSRGISSSSLSLAPNGQRKTRERDLKKKQTKKSPSSQKVLLKQLLQTKI